jgi:acetate kinase
MSKTVLVINAGSSSIKYQLTDPVDGTAIASGIVERIGESNGIVTHKYNGEAHTTELPIADHGIGLRKVLELFEQFGPNLSEAGIVAVGHRVVQGGSVFPGPTVVTDEVVEQIRGLIPLAPLHNPGHVRGIEVGRELFKDVPHVAIFDTSFFQTMPAESYTYALPKAIAEKHAIRRYGFHGTSHQYVSREVSKVLGKPNNEVNQIVLHIGSGASVSAIKNGEAVETSMGLTPLEGLVMGTRTGDIDPAVIFHLYRTEGLSIDEIDTMFNKQSGLKGMAGENDFRQILRLIDEGSADAQLALDVFVHRIVKYIGSYMGVIGGLPDSITFTAGVGENNALVRDLVIGRLAGFGIKLDADKNSVRSDEPRIISTADSTVNIMVVPTNEEVEIARQTVAKIAE